MFTDSNDPNSAYENAHQADYIVHLQEKIQSLEARNAWLESKVSDLLLESLDRSLPDIVDQVLAVTTT